MADFPLLQLIINALALGATYVLVASGLSLLFGVARIFNFAHGEFYMLGAFAAYLIYEKIGMNYFLTLVLAMILVGVLGMATERVLFRPLRGQIIPSLVISFGLALVMGGGALLIFGERNKGVSSAFTGKVEVAGASLSLERLMVVLIAVAIMALLYLFIRYTRSGRAIQAAAQDAEVAEIMGVDINRISGLTFGISTALAGAAGVLVAPIFMVHPFLGGEIILKLLVVVVLGGLGTIQGAAVGGVLLGFIESFSVYFLGNLGYIPGFIALMLILLVRPWGLVGIKE